MASALLLKDGEVLDPGRPFGGKADVAIHHGRSAAPEPAIAESAAVRVRELSRGLVYPGPIDLYAHIFVHAHNLGSRADRSQAVSGAFDCLATAQNPRAGRRRLVKRLTVTDGPGLLSAAFDRPPKRGGQTGLAQRIS